MTNTEIIKKYLVPLLVPKEDNPYKAVFLNAWKRYFISAIQYIESSVIINEKSLENMNLSQALDKYSDIINAWIPEKTLEVFWIRGMGIYTFNQYEVLKGFFKQYDMQLYNVLMNPDDKYKNLNNDILLKLAIKGDLSKEQFQILEEKNLEFMKDRIVDFNYFKRLVKIGKVYNSSLIWENYLEFYKSNQIFIHNVKKYFEKAKISYNFVEDNIDIFVKDKFTRTLQLNPEFICKYNENIKASLLDNVVVALNNYYLKIAKEVEYNVEMKCEYIKDGNRIIMMNFNSLYSLQIYEEKIQLFNKSLKDILLILKINKDKDDKEYFAEIDKLYVYYKMEDKYDNKQVEKRIKI